MSTTPEPPQVVDFDLQRSARQRVTDFDPAALGAGADLLEAAEAKVDEGMFGATQALFGGLYSAFGGRHSEELQAWADYYGKSFGLLAAANCGYELDHLKTGLSFSGLLGRMVQGCSTAVVEGPGGEMLHVRSLDWDLQPLGPATRILRVRLPGRTFAAISFPGYVGMLTGLVPNGFSLSVNWAPPVGVPDFHFGPAFFARHVLTTCRTFQQALEMVKYTQLSTSAFFTLCGAGPGEGCVVERTASKAVVRGLKDSRIVQTNHFQSTHFEEHNVDHRPDQDQLVRSTRARHRALDDGLRALGKATTPAACLDVLKAGPLTNADTVQRMVLHPRSGKIWLERKVGAEWRSSEFRLG